MYVCNDRRHDVTNAVTIDRPEVLALIDEAATGSLAYLHFA